MGVIEIPIKEIDFHHMSYADPNGRLFWWQGQLYRALNRGRTDFFNQLFQSGLVQDLAKRGLLVETELTDLSLSNYGLVLKHRTIPFVSYVYEWCAEMLRDAALLVIDLETELAKHELTIQDAHPWNILFDGSRPVYVDLGSIVPASKDRPWPYEEFCRFFVRPLQLMSHDHSRIARWLLHDYDHGVLESDLSALIMKQAPLFKTKQATVRMLRLVYQRAPIFFRPVLVKGLTLLRSNLSRHVARTPQSRHALMQQIRREVTNITIRYKHTEWSEYYEGAYPSFAPSDEWTHKHHSVYKVLSDVHPSSVLDIGSNRGWYSQLAALLGSRVVAFDLDETCVTKLYGEAKRQNLQILPLIMDFRNPSPGCASCNPLLTSASERLRCDMVMALALVHHLVFKQHLDFEQIIKGLSAFTNRWLLVEFIPREDKYVREWWSEKYSWYTLENFIAVLRQQFKGIKVYPSDPDPRVLLLCEK